MFIREIEEGLVYSLGHLETGNQTKFHTMTRRPFTRDIHRFALLAPIQEFSNPIAMLGREEGIPILVDMWLACCRLYLQLEEFGNAFTCLREALRFDPVSANLCYHFGLYYEKRRQLEKAMLWYTRALTIYPHHAETHIHLGMIYVEKAKTKAFEEHQQDPRHIGLTLDAQSDRQIDSHLRFSPNSDGLSSTTFDSERSESMVAFSRPPLLYGPESLMDWAMAEMHLEAASRHDPQHPDAWYGLGVLLKHRYQSSQQDISSSSSSPAADLKDHNVLARSMECLMHALILEKTRPVRPFLVSDFRNTSLHY